MNSSPIKKLAVDGSIRQRTAREAIGARYIGFYASIAAVCAFAWTQDAPPFARVLYPLAAFLAIALFRPWHRSLHVEMDFPKLRTQVNVLGFLPFASRDHDLRGKRLALEQRTSVVEVSEDSGLGCLAFVLPFPLGLIFNLGGDSKKGLKSVHQWVLCAEDTRTGNTEPLLLLADRHVAVAFLNAACEVLPEHVG